MCLCLFFTLCILDNHCKRCANPRLLFNLLARGKECFFALLLFALNMVNSECSCFLGTASLLKTYLTVTEMYPCDRGVTLILLEMRSVRPVSKSTALNCGPKRCGEKGLVPFCCLMWAKFLVLI